MRERRRWVLRRGFRPRAALSTEGKDGLPAPLCGRRRKNLAPRSCVRHRGEGFVSDGRPADHPGGHADRRGADPDGGRVDRRAGHRAEDHDGRHGGRVDRHGDCRVWPCGRAWRASRGRHALRCSASEVPFAIRRACSVCRPHGPRSTCRPNVLRRGSSRTTSALFGP